MATTYYLDFTKSDSNNGLTAGTAWKTWAKAKTVMVAGDTLRLVNAASFTGEQWIIDFSGTSATAKITITSDNPSDPAIIDGNYAYPVDPGTGGRTSQEGVRSLFKGLVEIRCSFVDFTYIEVIESQGHGVWIFGQPGNRTTDVLVDNCIISHHRSNCVGAQDADRITVTNNVLSYGSDYISGATDGVSPGESWSAILKVNMGDDCLFENNDVFHGWGEGIILAYGTSGCTSQYNRIWDTASGKMYVQRGVNAVVQGNLIYDTFDEAILKGGTEPSAGMSCRNEEKAGAGTPPTSDVLYANNIIAGCRYNFVLGGSQGGTEAITNVRVLHNIFVNATSRNDNAHYTFFINSGALYSGCQYKNNLVWQPDARLLSQSSPPSGVTFDATGWSVPAASVPDALEDADDEYSITLTNPNATLVSGGVNPENYRPTVEYAGVVIAEITLDFYGDNRSSNWMGCLGTTGGGGTPTVGSVFAGVGYATAGTASGNYDISDSNLDGNTPEAVLTFLTQATTAGTSIDHWKLGIGAATATDQWAIASRAQDNQAAAVVATQGATDMTTMLRSASGATVTHESSFVSFGADKVTLNKAGVQTDDAGVIAALFGGADCEVDVGNFTNANAVAGTAVVTIGFEYDLLFVFANSGAFDDTNDPDLNWSIGVSTDTSNQYCLAHYENNSAAPTDHRARLNNAVVGLKIDSGQTITITGRSSTTFTVTTGVATGVRTWGYLALGYTGVKTYVGVGTTPTTATSKKFTTGAPGDLFKPGIVIAFQSLIDTLNSTKTDSQAGSLGIGAWTSAVMQCVAVSDQDNVSTTQTKQIRDTKPFHLLTHAGADSTIATAVTMDNDGTTVTFSAVETTARYFIYAAVEEATTLELTGGLDQGFGEDRGLLALADALTGGLDQGFGEDRGTLSTTTRLLPTLIVPHLFPSKSRPRHVSVAAYEPLGQGTTQLYDLTGRLENYNHENTAFGGYWAAGMQWKDSQGRAEDWLELGLGRRIVTRDPAGSVVWEGFVNTVNLRLGELTVKRGPLLDVTNRTRLTYSWVDPSGAIAGGIPATTDWAENLDSQDRYGILERELSTGNVEPDTADQIRDLYLEENSLPETTQQISLSGGGGEASISIECLGYVHYLNAYTYAQTTTTGTIDLSAKLQAVLTADPNSYLSSSYANITSNTTPVLAVDNGGRKAINVIKDLLNFGDGSLNRYLFGVYADRLASYRAVEERLDYTRRLSDPSRALLTPGGQIVDPWNVQAGKWLMYLDFLVGRVENTTALRNDPRAVFIESVTYRAPMDVEISGSKVRRLDQKLARLGLGGIGG